MSVRITDDAHQVALYDSVSEWAFGPTFPSQGAAEDFLAYTEDGPDLRTLSMSELEDRFTEWLKDRGEEFGYSL